MTSSANCQTFTSSTVISYSNLGEGPKVYQETSETRSAPGGVRNWLLPLTKCLKKHQDWLIHWAFICMSTNLRENKIRGKTCFQIWDEPFCVAINSDKKGAFLSFETSWCLLRQN